MEKSLLQNHVDRDALDQCKNLALMQTLMIRGLMYCSMIVYRMIHRYKARQCFLNISE